MGKVIGRYVGMFVGLGLLVAACSGTSKTTDPKTTKDPERICEPGAKRCDGLNVKVCSDDGTESLIEATCLPSQTCSDGVCNETSCVPNTKFCKNGAIWKCDKTGGGSTPDKTCAMSQFCREDNDSASCSAQACTPGEAICDGDVAATCAADGSGPAPGGTDCAATKQACYQGACRDMACTSGMKVCQHDDVYLCAKNGTDVSLLADCQPGEVCDADMGACRPKVCDTGTMGCDSTRVTKCNAFGSGWEPGAMDCTVDNKICIAGTCKKQTCTANTSYCQDGSIYACDNNGIGSTLSQTCQSQWQHCVTSGNYAYCAQNDCQAGQQFCDGNITKVCNPDGSWPQTGTDCGADKYCDPNTVTCKTKVCEPYTYYCKDGNIYYCDYFGGPQQGEFPIQNCPSDTTCKVQNNSATCVPFPCPPGETACLANKVGKCAADGQALGTVTDDCAAAGSVCGADGKCAKSVVEALGVAEDATTEQGGNVMGDVIQVSSARKVTEMQMNLVLAAPRELRWVIFEQSGDNFVAKIDKVISNVSGTGFLSSGAINFTLKAGKTYLFAVAISGGNSIAYFDTAPFTANASFGGVLGRVDSYYASTMQAYVDTGVLYQMKITTESP
jgi:hypothetical protein